MSQRQADVTQEQASAAVFIHFLLQAVILTNFVYNAQLEQELQIGNMVKYNRKSAIIQ